MPLPAPAEDACQRCDDAIEEPRLACGQNSLWPYRAFDPNSPPWDVGPVWMGYDPGVDLQ